MGGDVFHAVEFDQGEGGGLMAGMFGQKQIEQLERLGVVGQTGQLVFIGGAARLLLAQCQIAANAAQLGQRKSGKADQDNGEPGNERHQPVHRHRHRPGFLPGEETGDAPLRIQHRLHFAFAGRRLDFKFQALQPRALLNHAHETRIDFAGLAKQIAEFGDRIAQGATLFRPQPLIALLRQAIADAGTDQGGAGREQREQDDDARGRECAARARPRCAGGVVLPPRTKEAAGPGQQLAPRRVPGLCRLSFADHSLLPALRCGPQAFRDRESALIAGQQRR